MWELYRVDFKDNNSEDLQLTTLSVGRRQRAEEQTIVNQIPYSDTEAIEHTGKYNPYERSMEFFVEDDNQIKLINTWLQGYGKLRTFLDPGGYFKAHVISGLSYDPLVRIRNKMSVTFKINPCFFYLESGDTPIPLTVPGAITNLGTHIAEPYIKITGSGNINLTINSRVYSFTGVDTYLEIDSELKYVYRDTLNQGDKMVGEFPILDLGTNNISWTGTVTKIEIIPRWREL